MVMANLTAGIVFYDNEENQRMKFIYEAEFFHYNFFII